MLNVAIIGASGYTGAELARILYSHPLVSIAAATSRQHDGRTFSEVFPHMRNLVELTCRNYSIDQIVDRADFIFCAVPHKTAMAIVPPLLAAGKKVVDLSADFRLRDVGVYETWYQDHSSPEIIPRAVYGLPELYKEQITKAQLVANPGCYPTSIILGLAPLIKSALIDTSSIIADSKSGTSGAGRAASVDSLFCEVADGFRAYKVGGVHRHIPEIEQELGALAGKSITLSFTPHLLPVSRGILSTIYANLLQDLSEQQLIEYYQEMYAEQPFVRLLSRGQQPATQYVRGSNLCDIGITLDSRTKRVIITSALDNIVKGASGQAVQNMNLMCGFPENAGLEHAPFFP